MNQKYSDDILEDFTYARNVAIKIKQIKDDLSTFLRNNNFLNNTDSKDYTIYCHNSANLIVKISKNLLEKDDFITLHALNNEWYRSFQPGEIEKIKDGIIKIISLSTK